MKWVTRQTVHLDRVASPWLIKRFIDPHAQFLFIDPDTASWPSDAVPFALPGAELGMHDHDGTTFDKIITKFGLDAPELAEMAKIIRAAVRHVLGEDQQGSAPAVVNNGIALALLSEGVMVHHHDDDEILRASVEIYDSLFAALWARRVDARTGKDTFWERMASLRHTWRSEQPLELNTD